MRVLPDTTRREVAPRRSRKTRDSVASPFAKKNVAHSLAVSVNGNGNDGASSCGLTPREREVLNWVAAGKTNGEIGEILKVSPRTIEKHLENIFCKLGVENRTASKQAHGYAQTVFADQKICGLTNDDMNRLVDFPAMDILLSLRNQ